ncbi:BnaC04g11870D [Brassica napus]|uniref:BnaC04g11870D protein n=1 Tax=Brassica napus TaxID=3708 RepID=A0A078FGR4_BRANA|nr:BnaC04g11870D [Brassica napus]
MNPEASYSVSSERT